MKGLNDPHYQDMIFGALELRRVNEQVVFDFPPEYLRASTHLRVELSNRHDLVEFKVPLHPQQEIFNFVPELSICANEPYCREQLHHLENVYALVEVETRLLLNHIDKKGVDEPGVCGDRLRMLL